MPARRKKTGHEAKWDTIGITTSLLCTIHCVALPFFVSSLPFLGIELLHNIYIEAAMVMLSFFVGSWALLAGYRKQHGRLWPLYLFAAGMAFLLTALMVGSGFNEVEILCKSLAAICIVVAHVYNLKYRHLRHRRERSTARGVQA